MKCLIIDDVHPILINRLEEFGVFVVYLPHVRKSEVVAQLSEVEILIVRSKIKIDAAFLDSCPSLKIIGRAGAGLDIIDELEAQKRGIAVVHAAEGNADAVAEHTIGLLFCLLNKINLANLKVKGGFWDREQFRGEELMGKTVGILGYGNMGKAVAARLKSFSCRVIAFDKYVDPFPDDHAQKVNLKSFFDETEVLTIHLPLTPETRGMVNLEFLSQFKKPLILIHTARGPILPISDLLSCIETGIVRMAGLDVLENEPPVEKFKKIFEPYSRLFDLDQVLLTPHVAGWSLESYRKISEVLALKIETLISSVPN